MQNSQTPALNVGRGLIGAVASAVATVVLVMLLSSVFLLCRWWLTGAGMYDREYDLRDALDRLPSPALVCTVLAACSGWAAYAPRPSYSFARTLAIVSATCLLLWFVIGMFELTPRRYKSREHPFLYLSEVLILFGVPIAVTVVLTIKRMCISRANAVQHLAAADPGE